MQFYVMGAVFLALGAYLLLADLGGLWARHEHRARARGVVSLQRTPEWERATRSNGWVMAAGGVLVLLLGFWLAGARGRRSQAQPDGMKATYYDENGRQISDEEAERTGLKAGMEAAEAKARR